MSPGTRHNRRWAGPGPQNPVQGAFTVSTRPCRKGLPCAVLLDPGRLRARWLSCHAGNWLSEEPEDPRLTEGWSPGRCLRGEVTAGLGLRGRAGDTTLGGGGRGSRHDWATVTLETPGHRVSASGQLDSGAPSWARGPGCYPAVAAWTVPGRAQVHLRPGPPESRFGFLG